MDSITRIRSNARKNLSLDFLFYQENKAPLQILSGAGINYLQLVAGKALSIKVFNNRSQYIGLSINNGFYNLSKGASPKIKCNFESSLYEVKPKSTLLITDRYSNILSGDGQEPLVITKEHYQNNLVIYQKIGQMEYLDENFEQGYTTYGKRFQKLLELKIIPPIVLTSECPIRI